MSAKPNPGINDTEGEFDLIGRIAKFTSSSQSERESTVLVGIGDDGAVVSSPFGTYILTTDAIVDGVHFRSSDERWFDIGWKCAVSNLSDIAAMGGTPEHALVTLGVPQGSYTETFDELYSGMSAAFEQFGGRIVGGDVVSAPTMFVNLALTGHASKESDGNVAWLSRDAAVPGDLVCVTGPIGSSAGGLEVMLAGDTNPSGQILVDRHFRPTPRINVGRALVAAGAKCAMDISDGLVSDLDKIAKQSNVNIDVEMLEIPLANELIFMFGTSAIELALNGGEDYELVFTASQSVLDQLSDETRESITVIGTVSDSSSDTGHVTVRDENGDAYEPIHKGWDHLDG